MKAKSPSRTAEHNALFRAIEGARRPKDRIVDDRMALSFLSPSFRFVASLARNPLVSAMLCRYIDARWPGSRTSLLARTRLIDEYVTSALANGVSQIVVLGAGFDSRAYRLAEAERTWFFEIDHPNTSAVKKAHIERSLGVLPKHVTYVAADFECDQVPASLQAAGLDGSRPSLFLWEGVSNYLTEDAVRSTLSFIGSLAAGTALAFTYVDRAVLHDPTGFAGGREVQRTIARLEERWTFGIQPGRAPGFLKECGLDLDSDLSAADYRQRYYKNAARIRGYEFYHVIFGHVPSRAGLSDAYSSREVTLAQSQ